VLLIGCQTDTNNTPSTLHAKIAKAAGFKTSYSEFIVEIDDLEVIAQLKNIVNGATRELEIVNVMPPHYYMEVAGTTAYSYFLWLGEEDQLGSLMHASDTHTLYSISEHDTKILRELIPH